jgi:putative CocE/NonD family hydrolase
MDRTPETVSMKTRDGVRLDADIYRPAGQGPYPVLLMRQPYGRRIASTVCYAHPAWYADKGYIVVIQDVRGCGSSEGHFTPFVHEAEDGADTVAWAAGLAGSSGAVGMYGFSYQGVTQLLAASQSPPALKAIAPAMIGWQMDEDWAWRGGAFCLAANVGWAVQLAARRAGDTEAFAQLHAAARGPLPGGALPAQPDLLTCHASYAPHYHQWREHDPGEQYWQEISPGAQADRTIAAAPALFVGGWFDTHLPGTLSGYRAFEQAGTSEAALIVGPWAHFPWGRRIGDADFGDEAIGAIDELQVRWFDRHLKQRDDQLPAAVQLFDLGAKTWRSFARWPSGQTRWPLASSGKAGLDERDGLLNAASSGGAACDWLVHDPWRPVPSIGGAFAVPPGPVERAEVEARSDVLTYTSAPLAAPLVLAGEPIAELRISADRPSFDVCCHLSLVDAQGRSRHVSEGYMHLPKTPSTPVRIALQAVCLTVAPGERLRLSVAAASYPAFPVNPGTGQRPVDAALHECEVTTLRLDHDGSALIVPAIAEAERP